MAEQNMSVGGAVSPPQQNLIKGSLSQWALVILFVITLLVIGAWFARDLFMRAPRDLLNPSPQQNIGMEENNERITERILGRNYVYGQVKEVGGTFITIVISVTSVKKPELRAVITQETKFYQRDPDASGGKVSISRPNIVSGDFITVVSGEEKIGSNPSVDALEIILF